MLAALSIFIWPQDQKIEKLWWNALQNTLKSQQQLSGITRETLFCYVFATFRARVTQPIDIIKNDHNFGYISPNSTILVSFDR